jgi:hypothetical protein
LVYYVFDLLFLEGKDLREEPLTARRKLLAKLLKKPPENIRLSDELRGTQDELLRVAQEFGLEGLVAKRKSSFYESGRRSGAWVKFKITKSQEFVIGGYTLAEGTRKYASGNCDSSPYQSKSNPHATADRRTNTGTYTPRIHSWRQFAITAGTTVTTKEATAAQIVVLRAAVPHFVIPLDRTNHIPLTKEVYEEVAQHQPQTIITQLYAQAYAPFFGSGPPPFPLYIWDTNPLAHFVHPDFATVTQGLWIDIHNTFDPDYGKSIPYTSDPFPAIGLLQKSTVIFAINTAAFYAFYVDLLTRPVPVKFNCPALPHDFDND